MHKQHELYNPKRLTSKKGKFHTTYKHYPSIFLNQCKTLFVHTNKYNLLQDQHDNSCTGKYGMLMSG